MTTKFLCIVGKLDSQIKEISQKCIQNLDQNMTKFQEKKCNVINQQNQIIESMATTHESFDSIKSQILALQDELFSNLNSIEIESLKIYQNSYQETAPFISEARPSSELIINQILPVIADRLEHKKLKFNPNLEEPETIDFDFNDVIPKINDVISIWIPLPTMLELNEWIEKY